jgi:hypothetical protein
MYSVMNWMMITGGLPTFFLNMFDHLNTIREFINVFEAEVQKLEAD